MQLNALMLLCNGYKEATYLLDNLTNISDIRTGILAGVVYPSPRDMRLSKIQMFFPKHGTMVHKEVQIHPLLESLGAERFILILRLDGYRHPPISSLNISRKESLTK